MANDLSQLYKFSLYWANSALWDLIGLLIGPLALLRYSCGSKSALASTAPLSEFDLQRVLLQLMILTSRKTPPSTVPLPNAQHSKPTQLNTYNHTRQPIKPYHACILSSTPNKFLVITRPNSTVSQQPLWTDQAYWVYHQNSPIQATCKNYHS